MMKLSIKKFQQIKRKITLDLDQITIVTGVNGIGKTNISKILYCLLKSNCYNRYEPAVESINKQINQLIKQIRVHYKIDLYIPEPEYNSYEYMENYLEFKEEFIKEYYALYNDVYKKDFDLIDRLIEIIYEDGLELHISIIRTLLKGIFGTDYFTGEVSLKEISEDNNSYCLDFKHDFYDDNILKYNSCCMFKDVFYLDSSGTLLDHIDYNGIFNCIHVDDINDAITLDKTSLFDDKLNTDLIELENELVDIIGGSFEWGDNGLLFRSKIDDGVYDLGNVSSGVRCLGVLYLLLHYRHIDKDTFLIFDELENNLHSEVKVVLAEWFCKLVKKLGVHLYINTKSPMFIEAIEVYSMKHKLEDDVSYILLDYGKDNMVKASNNDRWHVHLLYDNLGDPYDIIDEQRINNTFDL